MTDIIAPPAVVEAEKARALQHGWPLSQEAQEAFMRAAKRGKKFYIKDGFNAALAIELPLISPTIVAGMIEQRAKECTATGATFKIRVPGPLQRTRKGTYKPTTQIVEIAITRQMLYHVMLGLPYSKVPAENWLETEQAAQTERPMLFHADGSPLPGALHAQDREGHADRTNPEGALPASQQARRAEVQERDSADVRDVE